jgi:hypothetical protein
MQLQGAVETKRIDPLLCDLELPHSGMFYPAGFPLHIATNSRHVLEAAAEAWAPFHREFDTPTMKFRVVVEPGSEHGAEPAFRMQGHLLSFVSDARNFAAGDRLTMSASFHLSAATAADRSFLRWFYLEAMAYMLLTQRYVVSVHAACVEYGGAGILLCGKSGAGKSTVAFACARAGFTYVSDDCTWMLAGDEELTATGKPHLVRFRQDAGRHFPELATHFASAHPNGKMSIEVPTNLFPEVRTVARCRVRCLAFLDRSGQGAARIERMAPEDAATSLLAEMPSYGAEVNAVHEKTIGDLALLPAWRVHFHELEDAVRLLKKIPALAEADR